MRIDPMQLAIFLSEITRLIDLPTSDELDRRGERTPRQGGSTVAHDQPLELADGSLEITDVILERA